MMTVEDILTKKAHYFQDLSIPIISGEETLDSAIKKLGSYSSRYGLVIDGQGKLLGIYDPTSASPFFSELLTNPEKAIENTGKPINELIKLWKTTREEIQTAFYDDTLNSVMDKLQGRSQDMKKVITSTIRREKADNKVPNLIPIIDHDGLLRGGAVTKESIKVALDQLLGLEPAT